jgi:hypothetical protein
LPHVQESLVDLARSVHAKNAERSLHRWASRQAWFDLLPRTFEFDLLVANAGEMGVDYVTQKQSALLPHEVFSSIWHSSRPLFDRFFGTHDELCQWWDEAAALGDEWYTRHPVIASTPPHLRVPVGLHGDDAGVHGQESVLVLTWNGLTNRLPTLDSRLVFTMLRCRSIVGHDTMNVIYGVLKWSFDALASGRFPASDHVGKAFSVHYEPARFKASTHTRATISVATRVFVCACVFWCIFWGVLGYVLPSTTIFRYLVPSTGILAYFSFCVFNLIFGREIVFGCI